MLVLIGVEPERHLSIGLLDLRPACVPGQAQHLVMVAIALSRWHVIREDNKIVNGDFPR